jgi:hypothetical protein
MKCIVYAKDGYAVANVTTFHAKHEGQSVYNARLIAAAPDLLAALESAAAHLQLAYDLHHSDESPMVAITEEIARARAALARANGE